MRIHKTILYITHCLAASSLFGTVTFKFQHTSSTENTSIVYPNLADFCQQFPYSGYYKGLSNKELVGQLEITLGNEEVASQSELSRLEWAKKVLENPKLCRICAEIESISLSPGLSFAFILSHQESFPKIKDHFPVVQEEPIIYYKQPKVVAQHCKGEVLNFKSWDDFEASLKQMEDPSFSRLTLESSNASEEKFLFETMEKVEGLHRYAAKITVIWKKKKFQGRTPDLRLFNKEDIWETPQMDGEDAFFPFQFDEQRLSPITETEYSSQYVGYKSVNAPCYRSIVKTWGLELNPCNPRP
ncbi:MAG: hypothetical protein A2007_00950 [Verrucomicrobia bacterium GWC2_42_7]|nr:MAG: hypothetical protein A2007_00950 [Verrucomicrobia bacterium GWC2_42_7]